jgi:hypothetical protein
MAGLIITSASSLQGGAGTYAYQLSESLVDTVILTDQQLNDKNKNNKILEKVRFIYKLRKYIKINSIDYVILQSSFGLLCTIYLRLFFPSLPLINIYHGLASNYTNRLVYAIEVLSAWACTQVVITNLTDGNKIGFKQKQIYIPNCARPNLTMMQGKYEGPCITVTRHSKQKDNLTLYGFAKHTNRNLEIFAPEKEHNYFRDYFPFSNVEIRHGKTPNEIYAGKSIFILATLSEGFPLSILEAASYQLPILVSDIPVLRSILKDHALYFKSPTQIDMLVNKLSTNPVFYTERQKSSEQLTQKYSSKIWQNNWASLIKQLDTL